MVLAASMVAQLEWCLRSISGESDPSQMQRIVLTVSAGLWPELSEAYLRGQFKVVLWILGRHKNVLMLKVLCRNVLMVLQTLDLSNLTKPNLTTKSRAMFPMSNQKSFRLHFPASISSTPVLPEKVTLLFNSRWDLWFFQFTRYLRIVLEVFQLNSWES